MKILKLLLVVIVSLQFFGCLKEMPEKELTVSIADEDPIKNLQKLTDEKYKTKVMILGVPPLNILGKDFSPVLLDSVILNLKKYNPQLICIDEISSSEIQIFLNTDEYHKNLAYSIAGKEIEIAEKLAGKIKSEFREVRARLDSILNSKETISELSLSEKEELIRDFLVSFDAYSAALIWSYLKNDEKNKTKLELTVKSFLDSLLRSNDENSSVGLRLAKELKLKKLYRINDYSDKYYLDKISEPLYQEMLLSEVYRNSRKDILDLETDKKLKQAMSEKNLLPFFKHINSKEYALRSVDKNWGLYYRMFLESGLDRTRASLWEMKCLRIAANIREVSALNPGKNILVIIDVSAKPFLEEYLLSAADIKILQFNDIL